MAFNQTTFDVDTDRNEIHVELGREDWTEIVINKELHLHISSSADGAYIIDKYIYSTMEEPSEDDLIGSDVIDIENDLTKYITVKTQTTDGTDEDYEDTDSWYVVGSKLYHDGELMSEELTELDDIVSAILDREHDYVTSIEFEDEEIYEG